MGPLSRGLWAAKSVEPLADAAAGAGGREGSIPRVAGGAVSRLGRQSPASVARQSLVRPSLVRRLAAFLPGGLGPILPRPDRSSGLTWAASRFSRRMASYTSLRWTLISLRGVDPQTHLVAADVHHGDLDVVPDHDRLIPLTGQHQHAGSFLVACGRSPSPRFSAAANDSCRESPAASRGGGGIAARVVRRRHSVSRDRTPASVPTRSQPGNFGTDPAQADLASGIGRCLELQQRLAGGPLLFGQHDLLRQAVLGVDEDRPQQVAGEPVADLVADDEHLHVRRVGQLQVALRLLAERDVVVLEEDGGVGDDEREVRVVDRTGARRSSSPCPVWIRAKRVVVGEPEQPVGEGHDAVVVDVERAEPRASGSPSRTPFPRRPCRRRPAGGTPRRPPPELRAAARREPRAVTPRLSVPRRLRPLHTRGSAAALPLSLPVGRRAVPADLAARFLRRRQLPAAPAVVLLLLLASQYCLHTPHYQTACHGRASPEEIQQRQVQRLGRRLERRLQRRLQRLELRDRRA